MSTVKQSRFIAAYLRSGNATAAAHEAGYTGSRASLAVQGSRLVRKLRFAKECSEVGLFKSPEDLKEALSEQLWEISTARPTESEKTWKDVIRSIELLCKLHGLFDPPQQTNVQMNYFDVKNANPQELWAKLQEVKVMRAKAIISTTDDVSL